MTTTRKIVGGLIGLMAIAQTGCAALGIAMIGTASNPGKPLDTATIDPSIPTVGAPTQPGNGAVSVSVTLPGASSYRTQYVLSELTQIVIGLVDLNATPASLYFGYVGSDKPTSSPAYHGPLTGSLLSWGMTNPPSVAERSNFSRYLYYAIPTGQANQAASRTVAFTNIKPNTRVVAFAAAFVNGGNVATDVAGFTQTADFTTVAGTNTIATPLNLTLNRNLGQIDGTVTITPATPSASVN
ncbi:hypothetical protein D3C87_915510 [compost metagenome]